MLQEVRDAGMRTIVDPTAPGLGRDIPRIQRVNDQVDLNILVASGIYAFLELPNFVIYRPTRAIADLFVREITEGIDNTGVRAAFLKCCVEHYGLVGDIPRILEAVALASNETGAPVMVHTNAAHRTGLLALDALTRHGVDPTRIVIAHMGDSNDLDYLRAIADTGATLGCDRFGIEHFNPLPNRIETLLALLAEGYADRIHLSHDAATFYDFMTGDPNFAGEQDANFLLVWNTVLPTLRDAGIGDDVITQLTVENPARFFSVT